MADTPLTITLPDGRTLSYSESGDPDGPPCLFFHGTPGSRALGDYIGKSSKLRMINPDRPGYGHSTAVEQRRLLDWPNDVAALADHLGLDRFLVSGISGGGPHSMVCAYALPDRVVASAVLSGAGPLDGPDALEGMHAENRAIFDLLLNQPEQIRPVMQAQLEQMAAMDPKELSAMMREMLPPADVAAFENHPGLEEALQDFESTARQGVEGAVADLLMFGQPWGFDLADIKVPVFIYQGDADANVPVSHTRRFEQELPEAQVTIYPGEGHLCFFDHQAEIEATLIDAWAAGSR